MNEFKISIIVPVYNTEQYLERCISSILNQSYRNIELILVDDGSTDHSGRICDDIVDKDNRVKVIHIKNNGLSKARNIGMNNSTGKYIGFVDSDDYIHKDMYIDMINIIQHGDIDIVCCNYTEGNLEQNQFKKYKNLNFDIIDSKKILKSSYKKEILKYLVVWNKLYKKEIINNLKFDEDIRMGEDHIFCNKLYDRVSKIAYTDNQYYYYYRGNENSICNDNKNIERRMDQIRSYIKEYEYFYIENPKIVNLIIVRILYTTKFRMDKATERNDLKNIDECKKIFNEWHKILIKNKNINIFEKLIITLKIKSKLYENTKIIMYDIRQKVRKLV